MVNNLQIATTYDRAQHDKHRQITHRPHSLTMYLHNRITGKKSHIPTPRESVWVSIRNVLNPATYLGLIPFQYIPN